MTDKNYTDITLVLDRSGSMGIIRGITIEGVQNFIKEQQKLDRTNGFTSTFTLVEFNENYEIVYDGVDLKNIDTIPYNPNGWTALYDAVGKAIQATRQRLSNMPEHRRPGTVVFVIMTDGEENSSKEFNASKIKDMITHQQSNYNWKFVFLGANIDSYKTARSLNIPKGSTMNYTPNDVGMMAATASTSNYIGTLKMGVMDQDAVVFTKADYDKQVGVKNG